MSTARIIFATAATVTTAVGICYLQKQRASNKTEWPPADTNKQSNKDFMETTQDCLSDTTQQMKELAQKAQQQAESAYTTAKEHLADASESAKVHLKHAKNYAETVKATASLKFSQWLAKPEQQANENAAEEPKNSHRHT